MYLIENRGPLSQNYLSIMYKVLENALICHHRTLAVRVDLHLPDVDPETHKTANGYLVKDDPSAISRFIDSLKAKINAHLENMLKSDKRVHPCTLRYVWAMEYGEGTEKVHYHLVLYFNKDTFAYPGSYKNNEGNLASMIMQAWHSALSVPYPEFKSLIHFPENCYYHLYHNQAFSENPFRNIIYRASYLTKFETKRISNDRRSFGCSQK